MPFARHIVTKASNDGTFQIGDHIIIEDDGSISCVEANGWIDKENVPSVIIGMESQPDMYWLQRRKDRLIAELMIKRERNRFKHRRLKNEFSEQY